MKQRDSVTAVIDHDNAVGLETNSLLRKFFDLFFIPVLNNLPKNFKHKIKKTNRAAREVIENVTNHQALETLYSKGNNFFEQNLMKKFFQKIWFNLNNSKAVRNRLKLVKREVKNHLQSDVKSSEKINIISIASGSSRAIIETIKENRGLERAKLSVTFLDKNKGAIEYSKRLSKDIPDVELFWINDTVGNFLKNLPKKEFDVVEIVGFLDYLKDEKAMEVFRGIYNILRNNGIVIAANVNHNKEEKFITNVIDWPMIYRTPEELSALIHKAGFPLEKMKAFYEPLKVHGIVVAKK